MFYGIDSGGADRKLQLDGLNPQLLLQGWKDRQLSVKEGDFDLILFGLVRCILHSIWHTDKSYIKVTSWSH